MSVTPSAEAARAMLELAQTEKQELPDAILLDLDLGHESGFDLLRFRFLQPEILWVPVVVWSHLGDENRDFCQLFRVHAYVSKSEGEYELYTALESVNPSR